MNDDQILSQVLMLGYRGMKPSPDILTWIEQRGIGGIKIFGWNTGNLPELAAGIKTMQKGAVESKSGIPLFVATDQEGGWVRHVKDTTSRTPGNMALGASGLPYDAYMTGYYIGQELRILGINMNFAPTVDVYSNPEAHVIGPRAFSSDPVATGTLGMAYMHGMEKAGVISTAKHFPGHGGAEVDSHGALPKINVDMETLWERDLVPYRMTVKEGLSAIMAGHLAFPNITGNDMPATLIPYFAKNVLRERLGFDGILITDDLLMQGALQTGLPIEEICVQALKSGNDMILLSSTPDPNGSLWRRLREEYRRNSDFREQILESVRRILRVKLENLRNDNAVPIFPDPGRVYERIPDSEGTNFFFQQAHRSVSLIRNDRVPYQPAKNERVLLAGPFTAFLRTGSRVYPSADTYYFPYTPFYSASTEEKNRIAEAAGSYDTVIFCLANPSSLELLETIAKKNRNVIVISALTPVYLREISWVGTAIAAYGYDTPSFEAAFSVLEGEIEAYGSTPIPMQTP